MALMRSEKLYLMDIMEAVDAITAFMQDATADEFSNDKVLRSAVALKLTNIAEAATCISACLRERHPQVDWSAVIALGNAVLERYYDVDWDAVWRWVTLDGPVFGELVACVVRSEFSNEGTDN